jgi:hypothetical protein
MESSRFLTQEGERICAREMFHAWCVYQSLASSALAPTITNWQEAIQREQAFVDKPEYITEEGKKKLFEDLLISGELERRGFIDLTGVGNLLDYMLNDEMEEAKRLAAARALASCAFPEEITPGIRDLIFQRGGLEILLSLASSGKIKVYHEIDPAEVTMEERILFGIDKRFLCWITS